jgi:tight adherence protein B
MVRRATIVTVLTGVVVVLVLGCATAASASVRIRDVNVRRFPNVGVTISTDDPTLLSRADIRVTENGIPVQVTGVTPLSKVENHVDVVLAIDVSNSMRGAELRTALAAARTFVGSAPPWIPVGVLSFAAATDVISPITSDHEALGNAVSSMTDATSQGTALFGAVSAGSEMFQGPGQHNLIILTDGRNTQSGTLASAIDAAKKAGVTVFTVGLARGDPDENVLRALADGTGGGFRLLSNDDLTAAYKTLAAQLAHQYLILYRSKVPFGASARIDVASPTGSDEIRLVMPTAPDAGVTSGRDSFLYRLMDGQGGLVLVVALAFIAAMMFMHLVANGVQDARRRRELSARLLAGADGSPSPIAEDEPRHAPRPLTDAVERGAEAAGVLAPLRRVLHRAGWSIGVGEFLLPSVFGPVLLGVLLGAVVNPILGVVVLLLALTIPFFILFRAARSRIGVLQSQLPDVLMILASSLRAGHSFLQALDSVAKEIEEPASSEFSRAIAEIQLGRTIDDALEGLAQRIGSQDLEWAVTAIAIQRKVGGNLAEVLETVAATIRERETIRRQVRVLSAEGRWSVIILICLPFVIVGYLLLVNPSYLSPLITSPVGRLAIGGAAMLMIVGTIWMRKIVRLDA